MSNKSMGGRGSTSGGSGTGGGGSGAMMGDVRSLQESLHILLSRLAGTIEHVKNWPEAKGDDASIHVESTTKLIAHIHQVIQSIKRVEGIVKTDQYLRKSLQECQIPYDLLDLMDTKINPDCFVRGLLRESLGQLAGLKRRKLALEMLGAAVSSGLKKRIAAETKAAAAATAPAAATDAAGGGGTGSSATKKKKRKRSRSPTRPPTDHDGAEHPLDDGNVEPPVAKKRVNLSK